MFFKVTTGDHLKTSVFAMEPEKPFESAASSSTTLIDIKPLSRNWWNVRQIKEYVDQYRKLKHQTFHHNRAFHSNFMF